MDTDVSFLFFLCFGMCLGDIGGRLWSRPEFRNGIGLCVPSSGAAQWSGTESGSRSCPVPCSPWRRHSPRTSPFSCGCVCALFHPALLGIPLFRFLFVGFCSLSVVSGHVYPCVGQFGVVKIWMHFINPKECPIQPYFAFP